MSFVIVKNNLKVPVVINTDHIIEIVCSKKGLLTEDGFTIRMMGGCSEILNAAEGKKLLEVLDPINNSI